MNLPPIADYGLIGDTRTAALVSSDGGVDWMCAPHFDGDPLFGRLVGGPTAGTYRVGPRMRADACTRRYRPGTATLETTWTFDDRTLTLTEGMVADLSGRLLPVTMLVRRVTSEGGPVDVAVEFDPRRGVTHDQPITRVRPSGGFVCTWGSLAVSLDVMPAVDVFPGEVTNVTVQPGEPVTFVLAVAHREPLVRVHGA